nr:hypothetical protein [uncultured Halomonas sp.]
MYSNNEFESVIEYIFPESERSPLISFLIHNRHIVDALQLSVDEYNFDRGNEDRIKETKKRHEELNGDNNDIKALEDLVKEVGMSSRLMKNRRGMKLLHILDPQKNVRMIVSCTHVDKEHQNNAFQYKSTNA